MSRDDSETEEYELWTRRETLQTGGAGAAAMALPMSHSSNPDGVLAILKSKLSGDPDLVVMHNGEVVTEDPKELNFEGSAIKEVTEVNDYDGLVRVTLEGGSGSSAFVDTDGDGVAELQDDHVDLQGGDARNVGVLGTDGLQGGYEAKVRGIGPSGVVASIDPASTSTPIQDAIDAVAADGSGTVTLPPATIQEAGTITREPMVSLIGHPGRTRVELTDTTSDGMVIDGAYACYTHGIVFDGTDQTATGRKAWRFINSATWGFHVGWVGFRNWGDGVIYCDTGHPYSSHWQFLLGRTAGSVGYNGSFLDTDDSLGPGFTCSNIYCGSQDASTEVRIGRISDAGARFESINVGGEAGVVFHDTDSRNNALFHVGEIADFGGNNGTAKSAAVIFEGAGQSRLGMLRLTNSPPSYDYGVQLGPNLNRDNDVGMIEVNNATLNNNFVNLATAAGGDYETVFRGHESHVTNNSAAAAGSTGVYCLRGFAQV